MKLSIVVPHYKEEWETCHTLFDSIELQHGINMEDIEVIVVNDGKVMNIGMEHFDKYHYKIDVFLKEHEGVSSARNFGLDKASGDYVMFCDIDDSFLSLYSINMILQKAVDSPDVITSAFIEETKDTEGNNAIIRHDNDVTFVHGKAFRKEYLISHNIRFNDDLTIHEDGYFVALATICAENKADIVTPIYLWRWNKNSVVRNDTKDFVLRTYDHLIKARIAYIEQLYARGKTRQAEQIIIKAFCDAYYDFQKPPYRKNENKPYIDRAEKSVKELYDRYYQTLIHQKPSEIGQISQMAREKAIKNGLALEVQTMNEWLSHIKTIKA